MPDIYPAASRKSSCLRAGLIRHKRNDSGIVLAWRISCSMAHIILAEDVIGYIWAENVFFTRATSGLIAMQAVKYSNKYEMAKRKFTSEEVSQAVLDSNSDVELDYSSDLDSNKSDDETRAIQDAENDDDDDDIDDG